MGLDDRSRATVHRLGATLLSVLLGTAALAGCTNDPSVTREKAATETETAQPPTLEAEWSIPGLLANPGRTGENHWMTYQSTTAGIGQGTHLVQGPVLLVDTRTGKARTRTPEPARWPCLQPTRISDDGVVPILWAAYTMNPILVGNTQDEPCTRITVQDATTGELLWRAPEIDLGELGAKRAVTADDTAVAVVDARGNRVCFAARTGEAVDADAPSCRSLADRVRHRDLPDLVDPDGEPAPLTLPWDRRGSIEIDEIGRTDDVLLVEAVGEDSFVRAHDLTTGETLWQDDDLELDPHADAWDRRETYFVAPSGIVRVSYEHPDADAVAVDVEDAPEMMKDTLVTETYPYPSITGTPMVLTAVDPQTGEDLRPVARIDGGLFAHQFGDVTVALTQQENALRSTISGFALPEWSLDG